MDIRSRNNLFLIASLLVVVFTISFSIYEHRREHAFRVDILHSQLQLNNYRTLHHVGEGVRDTTSFRITLIDTEGNVIYDSREKDVKKMGNHLHRKEIADALRTGSGYDIKRASETNGEKYFYSATYFAADSSQYSLPVGLVIRSAVPYNTPLTASLERDYTFFYYTIGILVLILLIMLLRHRLARSEEDKRRIKRQLTENAAHELKTPAAAIEGYLETIINMVDPMPSDGLRSDNCGSDVPQIVKYLHRCYAQSQRMSRLLQDMSTLTRLDEAAIARPSVLIDAAEILQGIADETRARFTEQGMELDMHSLPDTLPLQGDSALVYSLFRNIFDNALAYATGATRFVVSATASSTDYVFTFSDNGQGVRAEHLPHLFERFYRVDKGRSRKLGGTGLGLAIVKNIAVQYGGSAVASATPGGGLTVVIVLSAEMRS